MFLDLWVAIVLLVMLIVLFVFAIKLLSLRIAEYENQNHIQRLGLMWQLLQFCGRAADHLNETDECFATESEKRAWAIQRAQVILPGYKIAASVTEIETFLIAAWYGDLIEQSQVLTGNRGSLDSDDLGQMGFAANTPLYVQGALAPLPGNEDDA
jgi:hypothetical protein